MEYTNEHIDELIAKSLEGGTSEAEKNALHNWLVASEENKKYFENILQICEIAGEVFVLHKADVDAAWNRFRKKLAEETGKTKQPVFKKIIFSVYSKAAAIALMLGIGYLIYHYSGISEKEITVASHNDILSHTLADGSFVSLQPQSRITFTSGFNMENRELKLTGEAYFRVQREAELPFVVKAEDVFIKDIGTAFSVKANPGDSVITVFVEEGKVIFYSEQNTGIMLEKNETGIYSIALNVFYKKEIPFLQNSSAGTTLKFENTGLKTVADTLSKIFGVKIALACPQLGDLKLTAAFTNEGLNFIIETITETLNLSRKQNQEMILLDGGRCKQ